MRVTESHGQICHRQTNEIALKVKRVLVFAGRMLSMEDVRLAEVCNKVPTQVLHACDVVLRHCGIAVHCRVRMCFYSTLLPPN